jgi:short chain dehydrogenase
VSSRHGHDTVTDVLITGGSDGIGLAVAKLLAAGGDTRVTLVARSEAKLREAVAQLPGVGHDFIVADLSAPEGMDLVVHRLAARHYDVLINNAGAGLYGRFAELPLDDQLRMMRLNMESVSVLSHAYLRRAKHGVVPGVRTAARERRILGDKGIRGDAERGAVVGEQEEWRLCPLLQPGSHRHSIPRCGGQVRGRLSACSRAVTGERGARARGCTAEASRAARHHRPRHAPVDSAAAARQPEDSDQHDGKEQPDLVIVQRPSSRSHRAACWMAKTTPLALTAGTVASAAAQSWERDCRYENPPPSPCRYAVRLCRLRFPPDVIVRLCCIWLTGGMLTLPLPPGLRSPMPTR